MNIVIAGAGRVGYQLARSLSRGHSVTVIDRNAEALQRLQESLDILPVHGDIEDPSTYRKIIDREADLFIAVTDMDEANILSTLIADDAITLRRKFIRLKNVRFHDTKVTERLGVDEAFYPLELTSRAIASLLDYPRANNVKRFEYTRFKLISVHVSADVEPFVPQKENVAIVGIERRKEFLIPSEGTAVEPGDLVYFFGDERRIRELCPILEHEASGRIERCVVFGADELGINVARSLVEHGVDVKLVEKSLDLCRIAEEQLEGAVTTLSSKYGTASLFEEEDLGRADIAIAATADDEYNIVKCLEAKEHGIPKVAAVNNELEYYNVMHALGIVVIRGPKVNAYNAILERINSSRIVTERKYCGGKAQIYLRKIFPGSPIVGRSVAPPKKVKETALLHIRDDRMQRFTETVSVEEGDLFVAFSTAHSAPKIREWIDGL